jgi:hypothetical protein
VKKERSVRCRRALQRQRRPPQKAAATKPRGRRKAAPTRARETQEHRLKPVLPDASGLDVGFDEPEILVHFTGDCCEEVHGDGIFEVVGFLDGGAQGVGVVAYVVN